MVLRGTSNSDLLEGTSLNDLIEGFKGDDTIFGRSGDDTIFGGSNNDSISGGSGNDSIVGGSGNDSIRGAKGNDFLKGGSGFDTISGGSGNDTLDGGSNDDTLIGVSANTRGVGEIDLILGSQGDSGADTIVLGDNNGSYYVGNGSLDYALIQRFDVGGTNRDTIQLAGTSSDYTIASNGTDTNIFFNTLTGTDLVAKVQGINVIQLSDRLEFLGDNLVSPNPNPEIGKVIEGSNRNDFLTGTIGNDTIFGKDGNDTIRGDRGNDSLLGENGNDSLIGGRGNDTLVGGVGNDTLIGVGSNFGAGELDVFIASQGTSGSDTIVLGDGVNVFYNSPTGSTEFATIKQLDISGNNQDKIQLTGTAFDYRLGAAGNNNTELFFVDNFGNRERIARIEGVSVSNLNLFDSTNFVYV